MKITQQIKVVEEARHALEKARDLIFDAGKNLEEANTEFKDMNRYYAIRILLNSNINFLKQYEQRIRAEDLNKEQTKVQDA
jgi:hypothetical protein